MNTSSQDKCKPRFGSINSITGEPFDGFIDKSGKMKFKRKPWYWRLFHKVRPPSKIELLKVIYIEFRVVWPYRSEYETVKAGLYRRYNPFSGETYEIYSTPKGYKISYDVDGWAKFGELIQTSCRRALD